MNRQAILDSSQDRQSTCHSLQKLSLQSRAPNVHSHIQPEIVRNGAQLVAIYVSSQLSRQIPYKRDYTSDVLYYVSNGPSHALQAAKTATEDAVQLHSMTQAIYNSFSLGQNSGRFGLQSTFAGHTISILIQTMYAPNAPVQTGGGD